MRLLLVSAIVSCLPMAAQEAWTPALQMKVAQVGDVQVSPDGKLVAWTERRAVMDGEKSEYVSHVFLSRSDGSRRIQLTRGEKGAGNPRWSDDGAWLYFASERSGKRNIYRIPVAGGEAEMLTDWKGTLGGFAVSPDGKRLAFTAIEEDKEVEKRKKEKRDWNVADDSPRNQALWILPLEGRMPGLARCVTKEPYHVANIDWSPDSKFIAFVHTPTPDANEARVSDIAEIEVATGSVKDLANSSAAESSPRYSPDGRFVAFLKSTPKPSSPGPVRIALLDRASGTARELAPTPDESPNIAGWFPDSRALLAGDQSGMRFTWYRVPLDAPVEELLTSKSGTYNAQASLSAGGTTLAVPFQSFTEAAEVYALPLNNGKPGERVKLSAANSGLPASTLGRSEVVRWKGKDGLAIEGVLTYPTNYQPGKRVPMVLNIHGGPAGAFNEGFIGNPGVTPVASLAAKGYAVLQANPRGSSGYGSGFRQKVIQDWGGLDFADLMAGVDHVIGMGVADGDRLAVLGWSYGGYMTAWTITQTPRFKAAAIGAGITNHVSMYGTQDIPSVYEDYFGGPPWEQAQVYAKSSPMNYIQNVKTPTLLQHGESDPRVPPTQAREYYRALKRRGVPVRMVTYPRMPHGPNEPKFAEHVMQEHVDWIVKYVPAGE
jgi:dipeptidyl aminopeptidase/acylaminoacyl peptidase